MLQALLPSSPHGPREGGVEAPKQPRHTGHNTKLEEERGAGTMPPSSVPG